MSRGPIDTKLFKCLHGLQGMRTLTRVPSEHLQKTSGRQVFGRQVFADKHSSFQNLSIGIAASRHASLRMCLEGPPCEIFVRLSFCCTVEDDAASALCIA